MYPTKFISDIIPAMPQDARCIKHGVTLPKDLVKKIDKIRGDVPRSRFNRRLLEKVCEVGGLIYDSPKKREHDDSRVIVEAVIGAIKKHLGEQQCNHSLREIVVDGLK